MCGPSDDDRDWAVPPRFVLIILAYLALLAGFLVHVSRQTSDAKG